MDVDGTKHAGLELLRDRIRREALAEADCAASIVGPSDLSPLEELAQELTRAADGLERDDWRRLADETLRVLQVGMVAVAEQAYLGHALAAEELVELVHLL